MAPPMDDLSATRRRARIAGAWYLAMGVTAPFGLLYVPGQIVVKDDAAATAERLRTAEGLVRLGIGSELVHQVIAVFLVLALYRLFKPVDEHLARLLVCLGALVSVPIMFVNVLNHVAALTLAKGAPFLAPLDGPQRDALAYLFVRLHGQGITLASVFWGLWLFPFGLLVIRSGFIPRILGVLLLVAGAAYLASSFTAFVAPQFSGPVDRVALTLEMAEIPIIFWLAIWGARQPATRA